ncbi:MAG: hypothetical protein QXX95_08520 [Nitrososphaerales archaeon]
MEETNIRKGKASLYIDKPISEIAADLVKVIQSIAHKLEEQAHLIRKLQT